MVRENQRITLPAQLTKRRLWQCGDILQNKNIFDSVNYIHKYNKIKNITKCDHIYDFILKIECLKTFNIFNSFWPNYADATVYIIFFFKFGLSVVCVVNVIHKCMHNDTFQNYCQLTIVMQGMFMSLKEDSVDSH